MDGRIDGRIDGDGVIHVPFRSPSSRPILSRSWYARMHA
jgi:hypothetical protein